ncbi:MAG: SMP-30/gluconolactonase/LRE family protein, partial [Armatimonadetes bacterium]|nr:SMP-30/gluconolactonase/LRE family protein [Armatimonadota bacterium]
MEWTRVASGILSPEGPAVDREGRIFLVSRWAGRVVSVEPDGAVREVVQTGGKPQSVALLPEGELLLADARNHALQRIGRDGVLTTVVGTVENAPFLGPNDLVVAEGGVVYLTDPGLDMEAPGRVLRIEVGTGRAAVLGEGYRFPNGITLSADGRFLLLAESVPSRILRFELQEDGHRLGPPELFFQFEGHHPDGIAFDAAGNLLVALCGGGTLEVIGPDGRRVDSLPVGGPDCTN